MTTLLLSHRASLDHLTPPGHPERPDRIRAVEEVLGESRFDTLVREEAPEGSLDLVRLCHNEHYIDELRHIDHGTLVLTTKRLAFLGERRTNSTELGDLIGVHAFADSIKMHRERKQKAEHYQLSQSWRFPPSLAS